MSLIPTSCVDDFYEDPDSIREYALSLDYKKQKGNYPGVRTKDLSSINKDFSVIKGSYRSNRRNPLTIRKMIQSASRSFFLF